MLPIPSAGNQPASGRQLLVLDRPQRELAACGELVQAFVDVARATLEHARASGERARELARQAALTRAARTLNESLDLPRVLTQICREAAGILEADTAAVFCVARGARELAGADEAAAEAAPTTHTDRAAQPVNTTAKTLVLEAAHGLPPEAIGLELGYGVGAAGKVAATGRPFVTEAYERDPGAPHELFARLRAGLCVPMRWGGRLRGVLCVGYRQPRRITSAELRTLESFAELAAVASRNASEHESLAIVARTDALTGCLNHAALQDTLAREVERCRRGGHRLSLLLLDLDHFAQINERCGHLVGDEVLRAVGYALRQTVRGFDFVGRYGGDEFALVVVDAAESEARGAAERVRAAVARAVQALGGGLEVGVTIGLAEWRPGETAAALLARAERALMYGKLRLGRDTVVSARSVPIDFALDLPERALEAPPVAERPLSGFVEEASEQTVRLRKRTRQLSLAAALGARMAAMTDAQRIVEAVVDELHRAFGFHSCAVLRLVGDGDQLEVAAARGRVAGSAANARLPRDAGLVGRALRERRALVARDAHAEGDEFGLSEFADWDAAQSQLAVPVWVEGEPWGALFVSEREPAAFDDDDAVALQAVADLLGASLRSARLYERLERAYMGTSEALASALEAKDAYTAAHSRSLVRNAEAVARKLGLDEQEIENIRLGAIFHDIGKIAVPDRILNKPGPLTDAERREMEQHTVIGERILQPVEFLRDVLPIVRHEHERWDGKGYPDGLAGEEIPLGARIILVCDAYDAMTSDRPYRPALPAEVARQELARNAGTQFDPQVVSAFLAVLDEREGRGGAPSKASSSAAVSS